MEGTLVLRRGGEEVTDFVIGKFNDLRLEKTGALLFKRITTTYSTCIKKLAGERRLEVSFGRFLQHEGVTLDEISASLCGKANLNCRDRKHILSIQDTVESAYPTQPSKKSELGRGSKSSVKSFFGHPSVLVDAFTKDILGLGSVKVWTRGEEELSPRSSRPIEEKESLRWIETAEKTDRNITYPALITHIADRECDIYEFFVRVPNERNHIIVRSHHDRALGDGDCLSEHMSEVKVLGKYTIELPAITGVRAEREAKIALKFSKIDLPYPKANSSQVKTEVELTCIEVEEIGEVPQGEKPIFWRLLTSHEVKTVEEAKQIVTWYTWRWVIEQVFRTMKKKGFKIEESQIETPESLMKMFLLGLAAAVQVLCLVHARDGKTSRPVNDVFSEDELIVLRLLLMKCEGKKKKNPYDPNLLSWASWIIARLGGWNGYPSERPPGPITMFDGLKKFNNFFEMWLLMQKDMCIR
jgi:hypothetical protein